MTKAKRKPKAKAGTAAPVEATPAELLTLADDPATERIAAAMRTGNRELVLQVRAAVGR